MQNKLDEHITMSEARTILEVVTPLAKTLSFNKRELVQIMDICNRCLERVIQEEGGVNNAE